MKAAAHAGRRTEGLAGASRIAVHVFCRWWIALIAALSALGGTIARAEVPQIAAGYSHTVALRNDGTVWAWGYNAFGQLGSDLMLDSTVPLQVNGLGQVHAIAAGFFHTVALRADGTVWAWGDNGFGQLGIGREDIGWSAVPMQVPQLNDVIAIAAGGAHTLALKRDGSVWTWGWNAYGQLGLGGEQDAYSPVPVPGLSGVRLLAAGYFHSLAVDAAGTLWAWGYNGHGQLGNGTLETARAPNAVPGLSGVRAVTGGGGHTLALKTDGSLWSWGLNSHGQLGLASNQDSALPVRVSSVSGGKALAAGFFHSIVLTNGGRVKSWGYNGYGQLGIGGSADSNEPAALPDLSGIAAIAASNQHSLALANDGQLLAWGSNEAGQLGNGSHADADAPTRVLLDSGSQARFDAGVSSFQDIWNTPAEAGWEVNISQHESRLRASWHTYDAAGAPIWLVMPAGAWLDTSTFRGALYKSAGQSTGTPYVSGSAELAPVGVMELDFTDVDHLELRYRYYGTAGRRTLDRYTFDASGTTPDVDYSDAWWSPSEPGCSVTITQQFRSLLANWYTQDATGAPVRFTLAGGQWIGSATFTGTLYRAVPPAVGAQTTPGQLAVGAATISFSDPDHLVLQYEADGVSGTKFLTRLSF